jgi:hypothetical protein
VEPKWTEVWEARVERSQQQGDEDSQGWLTYWDAQLSKTFYFNRLTREYQPGEEAAADDQQYLEYGEGEQYYEGGEGDWADQSLYYEEQGGEGEGGEGEGGDLLAIER